ncbi:sterol desaturase family protein [Flavobacteriaceae bacterium]|nr:sterol desaturase family protein [Flavobacteriaceae bacterium]MDB0068804.1 sterol desaturase family protein [Flavobacteriaceae bacterium]MDB4092900.1 sterol desaturase family protein [Flavobacteriaceae bacterium]MDB9849336.1 sterol desaturase family protein [Flavobacteriaceae bacterium]MDB9853443.1 sterol desaturase family protein [Flavobacteriaceae bacterium]|tara:strand:- start:526 stop:972 length:447 start_codon:yes stop_codon:yes gene_type:complete
MSTAIWIFTVIATFCFMEFIAWFSHKYIMHGFMWFLHKDHHKKDHKSWFERNDMFFLQYAAISMFFTILWGEYNFWLGLPIAIGIFMYGLAYFIVHDVFIHQRFKILRNIDNKYARGLRRAHKIHHKHLGKKDGECFGMLIVPKKYFK